MTRPDVIAIDGKPFFKFIVEYVADGPACSLVYARNWRAAAYLVARRLEQE